MRSQLGQWLADQISLRGLNQRLLADQLGVSRSVVSRWLGGQARPSATNCSRLSLVLNMPIQELLAAGGYPSLPRDSDLLPDERLLLTSYRLLSRGYQELALLIVRELGRLGLSETTR